MNIRY